MPGNLWFQDDNEQDNSLKTHIIAKHWNWELGS